MPRLPVIVTVLLGLGGFVGAGEPLPPAPPPVVFEGFGLGDLSAAASVARALGTSGAAAPAESVPLDLVVRGPGAGGSATAPLAAEVRSRIQGIDLAAGVQGDAQAFAERSPRWTGRIGMGTTGPDGGETVELRTLLESGAGSGRVGVEVGPRIERRLRRGLRVFLDGTASAEAIRAAEAGGWQLPGTSTADSAAAVGVSARTGILR